VQKGKGKRKRKEIPPKGEKLSMKMIDYKTRVT
jgi:hypothetical protein